MIFWSIEVSLENNLRIYFLKSRVSYCCHLYMTCFKSFIFFSIQICLFVYLMVLNGTFSNISAISWLSVLLVEETEDPEKTTDLSQVTDKSYHILLYTSP